MSASSPSCLEPLEPFENLYRVTASVSADHKSCGFDTAGIRFVTRDEAATYTRGAAK